jgi:antirestriction protein ArdC
MPARSVATNPRRDIHAEITNRLIALIEANPAEPVMSWRSTQMDLPINPLTQKPSTSSACGPLLSLPRSAPPPSYLRDCSN